MKNRYPKLVLKAFSTIKDPLDKIIIFNTNRGSEFNIIAIDNLLKTFNVERSLSSKGLPCNNAVAEATFKIMKTEFIQDCKFDNLCSLEIQLIDCVHWYNNIKFHNLDK